MNVPNSYNVLRFLLACVYISFREMYAGLFPDRGYTIFKNLWFVIHEKMDYNIAN